MMPYKSIPFFKMQALGNDFVVMDATKQPFLLSSQQIQDMSDRHLGVGFDQLLVLEPPRDADTDFYYRIFNADGSEVGQCGNGARCIARFIQQQGLSDKEDWMLQTMDTQLQCHLLNDGRIFVRMGQPQFSPEKIPYSLNKPPTTHIDFLTVNVGNPHAVIVVNEINEADLLEWGKQLSVDARFPEGVNVSVMAIQNRAHILLSVFERGVGQTQACGSAACAAVVLGRKQGLLDTQVLVSQPGGDLEVIWQGTDSQVEMIGSAEFVYQGEYKLL